MVFPGQGSQTPLMLQDFYADYESFRSTFAEAADTLKVDLWQLVMTGSKEQLAQTVITQTLMLVSDIAIWRVWQSLSDVMPVVMAGHSLGEYAALVASDAASFIDTLRVVQKRAQLMDQAMSNKDPAQAGAMLAILGLDAEPVIQLCQQVASPHHMVTVANINAPGQVVIGGHAAAVEQAGQLAKAQGAKKLIPLAMSVPSHSPLMQSAADELRAHLQDLPLNQPRCALVNNLAAQVVSSPQEIRDSLYQQMVQPVQWVKSVQSFMQWPISAIIECGPGKVLSGLNKRILADVPGYSLASVDALQETLQTISASLVQA
jgi:[acyl-carrier-protein] S-malonyltransferase